MSYTFIPREISHQEEVLQLRKSLFKGSIPIRLSDTLRADSTWVQTLSILAKDHQNQIIGSIEYWTIMIGKINALLLGPLIVSKKNQGHGVGKMLIRESFLLIQERVKITEEKYVLLVGDYEYYGAFGFIKAPYLIAPAPVDLNRVLIRSLNSQKDILQQGDKIVGRKL